LLETAAKVILFRIAMTLNISLSPESEARLRERAAAEGKDVIVFARETIEEKIFARRDNGSATAPLRQGSDEWFAKFTEWVASHPPRQFLADDSRDAIYSDEPD
jgi:predicted DNA-binding protein